MRHATTATATATGGGDSFAANPSAASILIVKWDRLVAASIREAAAGVFPQSAITICHTAGEALRILRAHAVDFALLGLSLPDMDGFDLLAAITDERLARRRFVISGRRDERTRDCLLQARVDGYFALHTGTSDELSRAIGALLARRCHSSLPPTVAGNFERFPLDRVLSPTELHVFVVLGGGADYQRAADRLGMSLNTIHTHRKSIMRKLGVNSQCELMREAIARGFVRITPEKILYPGMERAIAARERAAKDRTAQEAHDFHAQPEPNGGLLAGDAIRSPSASSDGVCPPRSPRLRV